MLFNSFVFLLAFLPAALILHGLVARAAPDWRLPLLVVLSFVFYGWWDIRFVPLLAGSILVNWLVARLFRATGDRWLIPAAMAGNLALLGVFKYFDFFADLANLIPGLEAPRLGLALPLGISFFTFHHIMYLADLRAGRAPSFGLVKYALYIAFFPQVLAGPLVRWSEIMHQFDERPYGRPDAAERFGRGLILLAVGLAKKVFLGDPLASYVNPVFQAAAQGHAISVADAWQATLGFTFQIYFDFSGYTDMALGIALMFGLVLPQNFDAPYRATSLQDFWRRWHMTLSRFLRDYLYIPFGGNRYGLPRQLGALFATMTLGGLWHGAGLTFLAWGALHGAGLGAGGADAEGFVEDPGSPRVAPHQPVRGADVGAVPGDVLRGGAGDLQGPDRPRPPRRQLQVAGDRSGGPRGDGGADRLGGRAPAAALAQRRSRRRTSVRARPPEDRRRCELRIHLLQF